MTLEDLCDLLFELSSEERMNIMQSLLQENLKLSHVSKKLDMTVTEASRHLQRLSDVQLVHREVDGRFSPTKYGELAIMLLSNLNFISENRQYFLEHDVSNLPYEFSNRLGELVSSTYENDSVRLIARVFKILEEADEYIWAQSYQLLPNMIPLIEKKVENDVDFRGIYPTDLLIQSDLEHHIRFLHNIEIRILVTDKEAMAGFKHQSGQPRYIGFFSKDSKFRKWCKDIHQHYWQKATIGDSG
jgi:predicted transcriptional regulator